MNGDEFRNTILEQIKMYLNGEITKEYFYNLVEPFYTEYASTYDNLEFHHIFLSTIADACLIYTEEPVMGEYDFTYELPKNFYNRVIQFLQQSNKISSTQAFKNCKYEYDDEYMLTLQTKNKINVLAHPNAVTRIATQILTRDGFDFPVYFLAFKVS